MRYKCKILIIRLRKICIHDIFRQFFRILQHTDTYKAGIPCIKTVPSFSRRIMRNIFAMSINRIHNVRKDRCFHEFCGKLILISLTIMLTILFQTRFCTHLPQFLKFMVRVFFLFTGTHICILYTPAFCRKKNRLHHTCMIKSLIRMFVHKCTRKTFCKIIICLI